MIDLLRILGATLLLAVAFAAFFPEAAVITLSSLAGNYTVGLSMDGAARDIFWVIGILSFITAIWLYIKAFTQ
jgi:hypothetical protein